MSDVLDTQRTLGLYDPAGLAWELLPFSFVADWFVPIGNYLENLNKIPQLHGQYIISEHVEYENELVKLAPLLSAYWITGGSAKGTYLYHKRTVPNNIAMSEISLPSFKGYQKSMSGTHVANAIALLTMGLGGNTQALRKISRLG
jgi:hypothetical protein